MTKEKALHAAIAAIEFVCRQKEPDGDGSPIISDLATWEIEARLIRAVTAALEGRNIPKAVD